MHRQRNRGKKEKRNGKRVAKLFAGMRNGSVSNSLAGANYEGEHNTRQERYSIMWRDRNKTNDVE